MGVHQQCLINFASRLLDEVVHFGDFVHVCKSGHLHEDRPYSPHLKIDVIFHLSRFRTLNAITTVGKLDTYAILLADPRRNPLTLLQVL